MTMRKFKNKITGKRIELNDNNAEDKAWIKRYEENSDYSELMNL